MVAKRASHNQLCLGGSKIFVNHKIRGPPIKREKIFFFPRKEKGRGKGKPLPPAPPSCKACANATPWDALADKPTARPPPPLRGAPWPAVSLGFFEAKKHRDETQIPHATGAGQSLPPHFCEAKIRREWDSNPRYTFMYTRFPSVLLKPLGHLSKA